MHSLSRGCMWGKVRLMLGRGSGGEGLHFPANLADMFFESQVDVAVQSRG